MGGDGYRFTVENPVEERPVEGFRRKLENNIKINFKEIELDIVYWCVLFQNGNKFWDLVNVIMNLMLARKVGNFFTI